MKINKLCYILLKYSDKKPKNDRKMNITTTVFNNQNKYSAMHCVNKQVYYISTCQII